MEWEARMIYCIDRGEFITEYKKFTIDRLNITGKTYIRNINSETFHVNAGLKKLASNNKYTHCE